MASAQTIDLDELVDGQKYGARAMLVAFIATLALVSDGFDLAAMGYIAPELVKEWGIGPASLVPAFSSGIIGMMVGGPLVGLLGDRYGRKRVIVWGLVWIGITTLATVAATNITHFVILRFLTGVGLGGIIPNVAALVSEITPRRIRGRLLVIVTMGMAIGISLPGLVSATLVPVFGWQALLVVGGILPLAIALAAHKGMPESIKFLAGRPGHEAEALATARYLRPELGLGDETRFRIAGEGAGARKGSFAMLFGGGLLVVTPLLWICQAANQMANFFALTWLPTLLQSGGASTAEAGAYSSLFAIGGFAGGIALLFVIDRLGTVPMVLLFVIGAPLVAYLAAPDVGPVLHAMIIAGAGLCVTGINLSLNALLGILYPTPVRSMGTGWTHAAGRLGALAAPLAGGALLAMDLPVAELTIAPAIVLAVGALASIALAALCVRQFGGMRVGEFAPSRSEPAGRAADRVPA